MSKIVCFSGKLKSGKSTASNFVFGIQMLSLELVDYFRMAESGKLLVPFADGSEGELDFSAVPKEFSPGMYEFMAEKVWPYVKIYNFADTLKNILIGLFGIPWEQLYTDEGKNQPTQYKWEDMPLSKGKKGFVTGREIMEHYGTNIMRAIKDDVWVNDTFNRINAEGSEIAIIGDCRFPSEVNAIKKAGGKVIRLTRNGESDNKHVSNTALDKENYDWSNFDAVLDNEHYDLDKQCSELLRVLKEQKILAYGIEQEDTTFRAVSV